MITWKCKDLPAEKIAVTGEDGISYSQDKTVLIKYPDDDKITKKTPSNYVIPNTVTKIKESAFLTTKVQSLVIPKSVVTIEANAIRLYAVGCTVYCEAKKPPKGWHKLCFGDEKARKYLKIFWGAKVDK